MPTLWAVRSTGRTCPAGQGLLSTCGTQGSRLTCVRARVRACAQRPGSPGGVQLNLLNNSFQQPSQESGSLLLRINTVLSLAALLGNAPAPGRAPLGCASYRGICLPGRPATLPRHTHSRGPQGHLRHSHSAPSGIGMFNFASHLLFTGSTFQGEKNTPPAAGSRLRLPNGSP